jgi:hypothetical protein
VPDSFEEHVKLMFDLQAVAFASDITRVFSFKLGRDGSSRVYPDSGVKTAVPPGLAPPGPRGPHPAVRQDQQVPGQSAAVLPREAEEHADGDRNAARQHADRLRVADGQLERAQPQALPAVRGRARRRQAEGQPAHQGPDGTPMANAMLTMLHTLGLEDIKSFGDSTGAVDLNHAADTTVAAQD